jgi:hypothetical protein
MSLYTILLVWLRPHTLAILCALHVLAGSSFGQVFFGVKDLHVGRLQLSDLNVKDVKLSVGKAEQGVFTQPVTLWFDSGTIALRALDNTTILLQGKIVSGSSFAALFECDGGPCVAPKRLSVKPDGLALTVKVDQATLPPLLGGSVNLVGSTVKLIGSSNLDIAVGKSQGQITVSLPAFTVRGFSFRPSETSDPLVMDISSQGASIVSLDLEQDSLELQKAKLVKTGFSSDKPYKVSIENQTATGAKSTAGTITINISGTPGGAAVSAGAQISTAIEVKDWSLKTPQVKLEKYPDFQVTAVSEITIGSLQGELKTRGGNSFVVADPKVKELVAQPDPFQVVGALNAISQGKSILPTGSAHVRYITAQSLKLLYEALGIAEDGRGEGHTIYLPVKDGVVYDVQPGTFPIDDPGMKDKPILVEGVGMVAGHFAGEAGAEFVGELLTKPLRDAALGTALNSMMLNPSLGVPTAWIVYKGGTYVAKKAGEIASEKMAETGTEKPTEIVEDVLVEPFLHSGDADLSAELVKFMEVPPPVLPPTTVEIKDDKARASAIRKERVKFISTDGLKPSVKKSLPADARAKLESYERLLEWTVNQRYSFREDVKTRIEPAWKDRQATKVSTFLQGSKAIEDSRQQIVGSASAQNAQASTQQENTNNQQKAAAINQMQNQMNSQMSGFSGGIGNSFGDSANRAPGGGAGGGPGNGGGSTGGPGGGGPGSMSQGQGCRDMYQGCFQQPRKVYVNEEDPFYITVKRPRRP